MVVATLQNLVELNGKLYWPADHMLIRNCDGLGAGGSWRKLDCFILRHEWCLYARQ